MDNIFCIQCGAKNVVEAKFCHKCGNAILTPEEEGLKKNQTPQPDKSDIGTSQEDSDSKTESISQNPGKSKSTQTRKTRQSSRSKTSSTARKSNSNTKDSTGIRCSSCDHINQPGKKFCVQCGSGLMAVPPDNKTGSEFNTEKALDEQEYIRCKKCFALNDPTKQFCRKCGKSLRKQQKKSNFKAPIVFLVLAGFIYYGTSFLGDGFSSSTQKNVKVELGANIPLISQSENTRNQKPRAHIINNISDMPQEQGPVIAAAKFEPTGLSIPEGIYAEWPLPQQMEPGTPLQIVAYDEEEKYWTNTSQLAVVSNDGMKAIGKLTHFSVYGLQNMFSNYALMDRREFQTDWGYVMYNYPTLVLELAKYIQHKYGPSMEMPMDGMVEIFEWMEKNEDDLKIEYDYNETRVSSASGSSLIPVDVFDPLFEVDEKYKDCLNAARMEYQDAIRNIRKLLFDSQREWIEVVKKNDEAAVYALWAAGHDWLLLKDYNFSVLRKASYFATELIFSAAVNAVSAGAVELLFDKIGATFEWSKAQVKHAKDMFSFSIDGVRAQYHNEGSVEYGETALGALKKIIKAKGNSLMQESPKWYEEQAFKFIDKADSLAFRLVYAKDLNGYPEFNFHTPPKTSAFEKVKIPGVSQDYYELGGYYSAKFGYHTDMIFSLKYMFRENSHSGAMNSVPVDKHREAAVNGINKYVKYASYSGTDPTLRLKAIVVQRLWLNDLKRFYATDSDRKTIEAVTKFLVSGELSGPLKRLPRGIPKPIDWTIKNAGALTSFATEFVESSAKLLTTIISPWKDSFVFLANAVWDGYLDPNSIKYKSDGLEKSSIKRAMEFSPLKRKSNKNILAKIYNRSLALPDECPPVEHYGFIPGDFHYEVSSDIPLENEYYTSIFTTGIFEVERECGYDDSKTGVEIDLAWMMDRSKDRDRFEQYVHMEMNNTTDWVLQRDISRSEGGGYFSSYNVFQKKFVKSYVTLNTLGNPSTYVRIFGYYDGAFYKIDYLDQHKCAKVFPDDNVLIDKIQALIKKAQTNRKWNEVLKQRFPDGRVPSGFGNGEYVDINTVLRSDKDRAAIMKNKESSQPQDRNVLDRIKYNWSKLEDWVLYNLQLGN